MKTFFLIWAAISSLYAARIWHYSQDVTAALVVSQAGLVQAEGVQQQVLLKVDSVLIQNIKYRNQVPKIKVVYRTVFVPDKNYAVDAVFTDTSYTTNREVTDSIQIQSMIKVPKNFIYQDENIYMVGTVHKTGVTIDSLSVPIKMSFDHAVTQSLDPKWKTISVTPLFDNPYLSGGGTFQLDVKKPLLGKFQYRKSGN
jgi:hypothetical protein